MKNFLILLLVTIIYSSCQKSSVYEDTTSFEKQDLTTPSYMRSGDDDEDEDEGECCRFTYGEWQTCSNNYQVRSWRASSQSCQPPLDSIQRQCASADVYYFYYNPLYTALRVSTNADGFIRIYNNDNQITAVLPYVVGARWVSVSFLPLGTYKAETYGVIRTFNR